MTLHTILPWLVLVSIAAAVFGLQRFFARTMLRRLGDGAQLVPLYHRPSIIAQRVMFGIALGFPMIAIAVELLSDGHFDPLNIMRSAWLGVAAWGWQQGSVIMAGPNGLALRGQVLPWSDLDITFDRDIGQQLWGLTLVARQRGVARSRRLYVARELKEELAAVLEHWSGAARPSATADGGEGFPVRALR